MTGVGDERPGRIVIGTLGLDQHEVGAMAVSRLLTRHGYEVIYLGRFNTPERLTSVAVQEDADLIGVSVHSWEFTAYVGELATRCAELGIGLVFGGSVLTERDQATLEAQGVDAVFGPYAPEAVMLKRIGEIVRQVRAGQASLAGQAASLAAQAEASGQAAGPMAGRVVIVTGAARGLGRAYTLELCRQGAAVVANDIDDAALDELASAAAGLAGGLRLCAGDVTDPAVPTKLLRAALDDYGQVHGLVANAGLLRSGPIVSLSDEDLGLLLDVHVTATFRLLRECGRYWRAESKAGRQVAAAVVLTTSAAGLYGFRAEAAYGAAKAAVAMLAKIGADELGRYGVIVNAISPVARTRLTEWMGEGPSEAAHDPLAPGNVAPVVAWLLGPDARDVTGRVLEAGNGAVSVPAGWRPGQPHELPSLMDAATAGSLLAEVLSQAAPEPPLLAPLGDGAANLAATASRRPPDPGGTSRPARSTGPASGG